MASIRLTNLDRDNVVAAALTSAFAERRASLDLAADRLGRTCYDSVFKASERKAAAAMPKGWLRLDSCLRFNVGGLDVVLNLVGEGVPVPGGAGRDCRRLGAVADPDLVGAVQAHLADVERLKDDRAKAKSSLRALLYSVSTVKALRELWPEGEPFLAGLASKAGAPGLPAPQISELNAMLGLKEAA
ncbi:hypothetical protein ABIE45_004571 [Methylobacterium sp. OAE515]|uniref:Nmad5 family putative nucleotide modification protein n=1 Tax=Methylobacterium sp. OAE515 TaxID=2817895 RepID=UPI00178B14A9